MASKKNNYFSGLVGPIVIYELYGKQVIRGKPREYKQTKATIAAQNRFGDAARISSGIRSNVQSLLPDYKLSALRYRLEDVLRQWLAAIRKGASDFSFLDHFQFNEKSLMPEKLRVSLSIDWDRPGKVVVTLPGITPTRHIAAPSGTESIEWVLYALTCNARMCTASTTSYTTINMKYDDKEVATKQIELACKAKKGELKLLVLGLRYTVIKDGKKVVLDEEKWRPVEVVGSSYE